MQILLTNDDGVMAPALWAMYDELEQLGRITVVAPRDEQSGVGHAITYRTPVQVNKLDHERGRQVYTVSGTPADCVKFALLEIMDERPDLVVSGINAGLNLGCNVFYSGTVAAALEGALYGVLSVAFSCDPASMSGMDRIAGHAGRTLSEILQNGPPGALAYNVNLPHCQNGRPEIVFAEHRPEVFRERYVREDLDGEPVFHLDLPYGEEAGSGGLCDVVAIQEGKISVTPLRASLTDHETLKELVGCSQTS
jgi:5'-nucleotidase